VVTSSCITLYDDETDKNKTFSESDWGDVNKVTNKFVKTYHKSKIHTEKAAWDFYEKHKKDGFKLATVLPSFTIGPVLSSFNKSSVRMIYSAFDKSLPNILTMMASICDVRDVALAHLRAAQLDEAVGHRFIITADDRFPSITEIFKIIEQAGYELNKNIAEPLDKEEFKNTRVDNSIMRTILKIEPTDIKKSTLDMVQSFFEYGIVKK
jgi:nucleoside-diphosphate-sugar epimerase